MKTQYRLTSLWTAIVAYFSEPAFSVPVIGGLLLAYAGELGLPAFHTDRFFEIWYRHNLLDYWTGYGRYLSKLLFLAMDSVYASTFLLLAGMVFLSCAGVLLCELWGIKGRARPILVLILCTFPFFYENFSFFPTRYAVPLGVAIAVAGVMFGGVMGWLCAFAALMLYQASLSFAAVVVLVWAALEALRGKPWLACVRAILVPRIVMIVAAIAVDTLMLRGINAYLSPISLLDNRVISSLADLRYSLAMQLQAMVSFFIEPGVFLFPLWTKLISVVGLLAILVAVCRMPLPLGNRLFALAMAAFLPFAAHGMVLALAQPWPFLFTRVLFGYAAVYVGIFAISLTCLKGERIRKAVTFLFGLAALGFIFQANLWHEFMELKNMADFDVARAISDRLKADPQYVPGLPLVMVGTMTPRDYLPYYAFPLKQGKIQSTNQNSAYALDWSKDRILMFFISFVEPAPQHIAIATENAKTHGAWPAADSVFVKDGVITVVLAK